MTQYLIRTKDKKTHILKIGNPAKRLGLIYTDFNLHFGMRDVTKEDIIDPETNKRIGNVRLYQKDKVVSVNIKGEGDFELTKSGEYRENGVVIPCRRLVKAVLVSKEEYKALEGVLEDYGVTHAYFLGRNGMHQTISQVFCFEKEGDLAGLVNSEDSDDISAFQGLVLALAQRIKDQEYIFEFIK